MDTVTSSSVSSSSPQDSSLSGLPLPSSRRTTHYHNKGGLGYILGEAWTHFRPFMPFFLISCLVVALVYLLQAIVYGGPFTDPQFFSKFDQRWPPPAHQTHRLLGNSWESNQTVSTWTRISIRLHEVLNFHQKARIKAIWYLHLQTWRSQQQKKDTDVNRDFYSTHKGEHIEDVSAVSAIQNLKWIRINRNRFSTKPILEHSITIVCTCI